MKSKLIIGIPLSIIGAVIVYNYFNSPPVSFKNIRGHYEVAGGPFNGCVLLLQPGAGINVFGHIGGEETDEPELIGKVAGNNFEFAYSVNGQAGNASLDASKPNLVGNAENSAWVWTKTESCSE